jgi:hypothetical protein
MLERLHEHLIAELQQNARSETVFVLAAIVLNFITLGINSGLASRSDHDAAYRNGSETYVVLALTLALVVVVNLIAAKGLIAGRETKSKLLTGLVSMYRDQNVAQYYDASLLDLHARRYRLLFFAVLATGIVSFAIPLVMLIL